MAARRVLFLTHLLPYPLTNGGYIRTYNLIRFLSTRYKVDSISFLFRPEDRSQVPFLERFCNSVKVIPLRRDPVFPHFLKTVLSPRPYTYLRDFSLEMRRAVHHEIKWKDYHMIFEEQLWITGYVPNNVPAYRIYANQLVAETLMERFRRNQRNPVIKLLGLMEARKLKRLEKKACLQADLVMTISHEEKQILKSWGLPSNKIVTVPMGVDTEKFKPLNLNHNSKNIINLGLARYPPNVDGILYFYNEIYPEIKKSCPEANLYIVGSDPPPKIRKLEADNSVTVTGFVEDLDSFLVNTGVFVLPLRVGAGVKVRLLNALAMGLPVVSTNLGIEGIDVTHGKDVLVADSPADFARAVIDVLTNAEIRKRLCKNGPLLIREKYTWDAIFRKLERLFMSIESEIDRRFGQGELP